MKTRTLALAFLLASAASALAQSPAASRADLRACLDEQDALQAESKALDARKAELAGTSRQHNEAMRKHVATGPLPNSPEADFVAYRARTKEFEARGDAIEGEANKFDKDVADFNKRLQARNQRCAALTVKREDREAVMKERAAGKK